MLSQDGEVIGEFFPIEPTERRTVIPISDIQEVTIDAVLAAEDGDFYKHTGLDYVGMLRAAFKLVTRGRISGGQYDYPTNREEYALDAREKN